MTSTIANILAQSLETLRFVNGEILPRLRDWLEIEISTIRPTRVYSGAEIEKFALKRGLPRLQRLRDEGNLVGFAKGYWGKDLIDAIEQTRKNSGEGKPEAAEGAADNAKEWKNQDNDPPRRLDCGGKRGGSVKGKGNGRCATVHVDPDFGSEVENFLRLERETTAASDQQ